MKLKTHEAESERDEAESWVCATCDNFIEHEISAPYCRLCAMYWRDVANGVFDE